MGRCFLAPAAATADTLRSLILTSPGVYHNYALQTPTLAAGIAEHLNIHFDVSLADTARWKTTDFSEGYDVLIYNLCMADETDPGDHPVLTGIPAQWTLAADELYVNLSFSGQPLLVSRALDGSTQVTAWLHEAGVARVFGTTLGHSNSTVADTSYQRLIANGILHVTGNLGADGLPAPELAAVINTDGVIDTLSAPEGVAFLGADGQRCAFRRMGLAIGPCYVGCALHPFKWNAAADACRRECESGLPASAELIAACLPGN